ncbi:ABC transporter permease [Aureimonas fodinaquatilis]|uniref:ABC transporter permease n=1 Tax=Aureimonas fodinaquatilis TaxID=2565783 RepID=A0A5B0DZU9_9HYPH|nr:ABC transporter permease [Aureimonas fodinaquatilis]KAA0971898.1 ABC transporter permease [Aureimonas fodinaquatilis]
MTLPRLLMRHETILLLVVVGMIALINLINPGFLTLFNLFSMLKSSTVVGLFAIGFFVILVIGGLDVSFAAIAIVAMYGTVVIANAFFPDLSIWLLFGMAGLIGMLLGTINGVLVAWLKAPSLIITLGTTSLFRGFLLYFVGTDTIRRVPSGMVDFSRTNVLTLTAENGARVGLHVSVIILLVIALLVHFIMRHTTVGRSLYAIGGNRSAAQRMGISVLKIETLAYTAAGTLAGIAGLIAGGIIRLANPQTLVGGELDVIAAVVIGGAAITGGRGSVVGVLLGVFLIVTTNSSLIALGVSTVWQKVAIGTLLLIAIGLPMLVRRMQGAQS